MTERTCRWTVAALAAAACGLAAAHTPEARGQTGGSQTAELGAGGNVRGDISTESGEQDVVGIDLDAGAKLDVLLVANFGVRLRLLDPHDVVQTVDFGPAPTTKTETGFSVPETGRYHLRVSSADGSQGEYTLTAAERWRAKVTATLETGRTMTFAMPAGATARAVVAARPKKSWDPQIVSLTGGAGAELLSAPVVGASGVARLPPTTAPATGSYGLAVGGGFSGARARVALTVSVPKAQRTHLDVRNGLTPVALGAVVSFAKDGVAQIFRNGCSGCHGWASSYRGVASDAGYALALIESGAMPLGGSRLPSAKIRLIRDWVATGANP